MNGSFLEKEFLSKELSGRKIELDEVVEPLLQPENSAAQKDVSMAPTSVEEEANDSDHEVSDQVTIEPRRSTRICTAPEWYGTWRSCYWTTTTMNLRAMEKRWWARILTNG